MITEAFGRILEANRLSLAINVSRIRKMRFIGGGIRE